VGTRPWEEVRDLSGLGSASHLSVRRRMIGGGVRSGVDHQVRQAPRGLDAFGVPLVDLVDPLARVSGGLLRT
jgi:hypothetical protein